MVDSHNLPSELEALKTAHARDTRDLATVFKKFALAYTDKITDSLRKTEDASTALSIAEKLLQLEIAKFSSRLDNPHEGLKVDAQRLTLALFLLDRTAQIRDAALEKNELGIFSLYVSMRDGVCNLLVQGYAKKSFTDIIHVYLDLEPQIIAASDICGMLPPPSVADIPELYKKVLKSKLV